MKLQYEIIRQYSFINFQQMSQPSRSPVTSSPIFEKQEQWPPTNPCIVQRDSHSHWTCVDCDFDRPNTTTVLANSYGSPTATALCGCHFEHHFAQVHGDLMLAKVTGKRFGVKIGWDMRFSMQSDMSYSTRGKILINSCFYFLFANSISQKWACRPPGWQVIAKVHCTPRIFILAISMRIKCTLVNQKIELSHRNSGHLWK